MEQWFVLEWRHGSNRLVVHEVFVRDMTREKLQKAAMTTFNYRSAILAMSGEDMRYIQAIAQGGLKDERRWRADGSDMFG